MTAEELKGRKITAAIAVWSALPALIVLGAAVVGYEVSAGTWVLNFGLSILLAWLLFQGYSWVRLLTIAACAFSVIPSVVRLLAPDISIGVRLAVLASGTLQVTIGMVLWRSGAVRAYFEHQNQTSSLNISGA